MLIYEEHWAFVWPTGRDFLAILALLASLLTQLVLLAPIRVRFEAAAFFDIHWRDADFAIVLRANIFFPYSISNLSINAIVA